MVQSGLLGFDSFVNGLLGVADMWTASVNEIEYAGFLGELYARITEVSGLRVIACASPR